MQRILDYADASQVPADMLLAYTDAKAAEFAREKDFISAEYAARIECNPSEMLRRGREVIERKLQMCVRPSTRCLYEEWQRILSTKTPTEIAAILRSKIEETEQLRRMAPFGGFSKEESRQIRLLFEASEIRNGFRSGE